MVRLSNEALLTLTRAKIENVQGELTDARTRVEDAAYFDLWDQRPIFRRVEDLEKHLRNLGREESLLANVVAFKTWSTDDEDATDLIRVE